MADQNELRTLVADLVAKGENRDVINAVIARWDLDQKTASPMRTLSEEHPYQYMGETLANILPSMGRAAKGAVDTARTVVGATGEVGGAIGSQLRYLAGLTPYDAQGTPNLERLGQIPGLVVQRIKDYGDDEKRAAMVHDDPFGVGMDVYGGVEGGSALAKGGMRAGTAAARVAADYPGTTGAVLGGLGAAAHGSGPLGILAGALTGGKTTSMLKTALDAYVESTRRGGGMPGAGEAGDVAGGTAPGTSPPPPGAPPAGGPGPGAGPGPGGPSATPAGSRPSQPPPAPPAPGVYPNGNPDSQPYAPAASQPVTPQQPEPAPPFRGWAQPPDAPPAAPGAPQPVPRPQPMASHTPVGDTPLEREVAGRMDPVDPDQQFRDLVAKQTAADIRGGRQNVWRHVNAVPIDANLRAVGQPGGSILEAGTPLPELVAEREMLLRTKPNKVTPEVTARIDLLSRAIRQRNHITADMPGRFTSRPGS